MTPTDIVKYMRSDLSFLTIVTIDNNPEAVANNLAKEFGESVIANDTPDAIKGFVFETLELGDKGQKEAILEALRVPFIYDNASESLQKAFEIITKQN